LNKKYFLKICSPVPRRGHSQRAYYQNKLGRLKGRESLQAYCCDLTYCRFTDSNKQTVLKSLKEL